MAIVLIDSYVEANFATDVSLRSGAAIRWGQSFSVSDSKKLTSAKFYLKKIGSPTGNAVAKIYTHSGTFGVNSVPTGSSLATSDNFDVSTLTTSFQVIEFTFSGANQITLSASTNYILVIEFTGGDGANILKVGIDHTSPTHAGSTSSYQSSWTTSAAYDTIFYVYGDDPPVPTDTSNFITLY